VKCKRCLRTLLSDLWSYCPDCGAPIGPMASRLGSSSGRSLERFTPREQIIILASARPGVHGSEVRAIERLLDQVEADALYAAAQRVIGVGVSHGVNPAASATSQQRPMPSRGRSCAMPDASRDPLAAPCSHGEERAEVVANHHTDWVCVKCGHRRSACGHTDTERAALAQPAPAAPEGLVDIRDRLIGKVTFLAEGDQNFPTAAIVRYIDEAFAEFAAERQEDSPW
jgi:hypothetical protein